MPGTLIASASPLIDAHPWACALVPVLVVFFVAGLTLAAFASVRAEERAREPQN